MKFRDIENKLELLEKIVRDKKNLGYDNRSRKVFSAVRTYTMYNAELDDEDLDIISKNNKILEKFLELRGQFSEISLRYVETNSRYVKFLYEQISGHKKTMDRESQAEVKQETKENFRDLCMLVRETLERTNLIDLLINRENHALTELGLVNFITPAEREEYKKNLLSERSVMSATSIADEIRNHTMCLFWVNKLSKVIDDCMLGYMIEKMCYSSTGETKIDLSKISDDEKKVALLRIDFMKSIFRYCDDRFSKDLDLENDDNFESYLDNIGIHFYFPDYLRYLLSQKDEVMAVSEIKEFFDSVPKLKKYYDNLPRDFKEKMSNVIERYNDLFKDSEVAVELSFIHDAYMLFQMEDLKNVIYTVKTELTSVLSYILLLEKTLNPSPYCKVWGFISDKKAYDDSKTSNVFCMELPGCIQPLMVHTEDLVLNGMRVGSLKIPTYNGIFRDANSSRMENYMATNVLFRLTDRQKTVLKEAKKKWKLEVDKTKKKIAKMPDGDEKKTAQTIWLRECKYYRVIEYMEAMAKDKPREVLPEK